MSTRFWSVVFGAGVGVVVTILVQLTFREFNAPGCECVCETETCPVCAACPACPPPVECPAQPTLEIRKPLSQELDAALAACKPELERTLAVMEAQSNVTHEALKKARQLGVSSSSYDWLENPEARKAASELFRLRIPTDEAENAAFGARRACTRALEDLFYATDAWEEIAGEEMDELFAAARIMDEWYEFFDHEMLYNVQCNMVAQRLECPRPVRSEDSQ